MRKENKDLLSRVEDFEREIESRVNGLPSVVANAVISDMARKNPVRVGNIEYDPVLSYKSDFQSYTYVSGIHWSEELYMKFQKFVDSQGLRVEEGDKLTLNIISGTNIVEAIIIGPQIAIHRDSEKKREILYGFFDLLKNYKP
ncbi:MAG: hypothetical protein AABX59_00030 [Nanoarchaeota archaeon]